MFPKAGLLGKRLNGHKQFIGNVFLFLTDTLTMIVHIDTLFPPPTNFSVLSEVFCAASLRRAVLPRRGCPVKVVVEQCVGDTEEKELPLLEGNVP